MITDISLASRIVLVDPKSLVPHPDRERAGTTLSDDDGTYQYIKSDILASGIQDPLKVQQGTNIIIGGHTRRRIALELNLSEVPVVYLDVDDAECRYLMVTDNYKRIGSEMDPMKKAWTFKVVVDTEGYKHGGDRSTVAKSPQGTMNDDSDSNNLNGKNKLSISEIASRFGMKRTHFIRHLDLLNLISEFQDLVSRLCMGVKAGSIVSHWSRKEQFEYYRSFPADELQKQDFRITEQDAIEWHKLLSGSVPNEGEQPTKTIASLVDDSDALNGDGMLEIDFEGEEEAEYEEPKDSMREKGQSIVDIVNALDGGGKRPKEPNKEELGAGAYQFIYDHPDRLEMLRTFQRVEEDGRGEAGKESALGIEAATREVAKRFLLVEDLDKRFDFAEQQLESAMEKCQTWLKKSVEGEIFPLQSILAGKIDQGTMEAWNELGARFRKIADQFEAANKNLKPSLGEQV